MNSYVEVVLHTSLYHTRIALVKRFYSGVVYVMFILNGEMLNCVCVCECEYLCLSKNKNGMESKWADEPHLFLKEKFSIFSRAFAVSILNIWFVCARAVCMRLFHEPYGSYFKILSIA